MKCNQCGAEVGDGIIFCPECGNNLAVQRSEEREARGEMPAGGYAAQAYDDMESRAMQDSDEVMTVEFETESSDDYGRDSYESSGDTAFAGAYQQQTQYQTQEEQREQQHYENPFEQREYNQQRPDYGDDFRAYAKKNKVVAGLLGIFLGGLGIHKFYLGNKREGLIMLAVSILGAGVGGGAIMSLVGIAEGINYLIKSDRDFYRIYEAGYRGWF